MSVPIDEEIRYIELHEGENRSEELNRLKWKWVYPSTGKYDDSNRHVFLKCFKPESFHYYFTIDRTT